ncbi:MAG: hypothetical protein FJW96_09770 [Actinobacteria bacterium]|nr:hypothetical protein [Actinomycetota bacterium]
MQRLRELSEEECYLRCYGWVGDDNDVVVVRAGEPAVASPGEARTTEQIRIAFEERLAARDQEAA